MHFKLSFSACAFLIFCKMALCQLEKLWPASTSEEQGMNSKTFMGAIQSFRKDSTNIHSLLVIRNGHTVLDAYFYPFEKQYVHDMASVTKSVTALLVGIAIDKGFIKNEDEPVMDFFPEYKTSNDTLKGVTVKDLLNMSSGLQCSWNDGERELNQMMHSTDWVKFMFSLPFETLPGKKFSYCSGNYYLLAEILQRSTKMTCHAFAKKYLFGPLGFGTSYWQANYKGVNHGWGDLHISTFDMAKIGYLILKHGEWNGRQVISREWIDKIQPRYKIQKTESYGYGWWLDSENPDELQAIGRGGQRLFIFKERNLVIATTGGGFDAGDIDNIALEAIKSYNKTEALPSGLEEVVKEIQIPEPDNRPAGKDRFSKGWLNKDYKFENNNLGFFSLRFESRGSKYFIIIKLEDGTKEEHAIGMDKQYEISKERTFGLPVAVKGYWINDTALAIDYNELCRIQNNKIAIIFSGNSILFSIKESTKGINETLKAKYE